MCQPASCRDLTVCRAAGGPRHRRLPCVPRRRVGRPTTDDRRLFEKICLEGFQAGLSWLTILRKREAFRRAFAGFDFERVARFTPRRVERLLARRRRSSVTAARSSRRSTTRGARASSSSECGSLAAYFWRWEPDPASRPRRITRAALTAMSTTPGVDRAVEGPEAARLDVRRARRPSTPSCRRWGW